VPFPFEDGTGSHVLDDLLGGPAAALTAVALVVGPRARASGWGARAAVALASRWRGPRRVVLADLDLEAPVLHEVVGVANDEGVIDLIEYGVSVGRLIRSVSENAYDFLPAGAFTSDAGAVLRHDGWERVLLEIAARRGTLLVWVPSEADGVEDVVRRAGAVVVLAESDEGRDVVERLPHPYAVLAILSPASAAAEQEYVAAGDADTPAIAAAAAAVEAGEASAPDAHTSSAPDADTSSTASPDGDDVAPLEDLETTAVATGEDAAGTPAPVDDLETTSIAVPDATDAGTIGPVEDLETTAPDSTGSTPVEHLEIDTFESAEPPLDAEAASAHAAAATADALAAEVDPAPVEPPPDHAAHPPASVDQIADREIERPRPRTDPAAREELIRELRDRQRAARLAGAGPAAAAGAASTPASATTPHAPASVHEASGDLPHVSEDRPGDTAAEGADAGSAAGRDVDSTTAGPAAAPTYDPDAAASSPAVDAPPPGADPAARPAPTPGADPAARPAPPPRPPAGATISKPLERKPRSRFRHSLIWTVGVVLLASLLAGAWHYLNKNDEPVAPAVVTPAPEPPPAPIEQNALPFVVAIEAHRELLIALSRVADLTEIEPELDFHVEPLEREGTMFYHVMAGPVPDSATALALRDTLITRGHKTGPTPTDVRATPLAFLIGDYGSVEAAAEQQDILRRLDIPGYVLSGEAVDNAPLYRLYVGGFGSRAEADVIGQMLRSAGIRDSLVTRTGIAATSAIIGTEGDATTDGDTLTTQNGQQ
jgi:hypothetical protein